MDTESGTLTVFFDGSFWVGVFERTADGSLSVCKVTFGAEPKDCEVWAFILRHYDELKFSPAVKTGRKQAADNPKRRQRSIQKQLQMSGTSTKSQQALQLQREERKTRKKQISREQQEQENQRRFRLKQQKRKAKHRGR